MADHPPVTLPAAPTGAIVDLAAALVRAPSRGGEDLPAAVIAVAETAMRGLGLAPSVLAAADGSPLALTATIGGRNPGPTYVLDACIDTAGLGDERAWTKPPFAGLVADGRLWGRGAADSKIAVAAFIHLGAAIAHAGGPARGNLILLFDADEHTGRFGGIKRFLDTMPAPDGVMIGYPENDAVNIGARGFWRAEIDLFGEAQHSGTPSPPRCNAAVKAARLIAALERLELPMPDPSDPFPLPPKMTVTGLSAGGPGFAVVPDAASLRLDVRLTPAFDAGAAERLIRRVLAALDATMPAPRPSVLRPLDTWPSYRLGSDAPLAAALLHGAAAAARRFVPGIVCGPSNIGNHLAARGIPATCGFGVTCGGVHGADEWAAIDDVPLVWKAYGTTIEQLLGSNPAP